MAVGSIAIGEIGLGAFLSFIQWMKDQESASTLASNVPSVT